MGMAASQARFLGLTARKTNVEYEGQQINQSRTSLANQSANYYNQMLGMTVPIPPNVEDYTKVVYSFSRPGSGETSSVVQIAEDNAVGHEGKYVVQYNYTAKSIGFFKEEDPAKGKYVTTTLTDPLDPDTAIYTITTPSGTMALNQASTATGEDAVALKASAKQIADDYGVTEADIYYANIGTDKEPEYMYFDKSKLSPTNNSTVLVNFWQNGTYEKSITTQYTGCTVERTQDNRISGIVLSADDGGYSVAMVTDTVTNNMAYEDAMNQYTYENALYQQNLNDINSKISIVQAEDRTLELRLKQLDTEQNAIQTEMDAVTKVLDKNIETTFKTFG